MFHKISSYLDHALQPLVKSLPSFTQDTGDILRVLDNTDPANVTFMACLDIESLYTSVPHTGALEALTVFLERRPVESRPETKVLTDLAFTLLTRNHFMFQDNHYLQTKGVSMGSKASPSIANLFVGLFEEDYVLNPAKNMFLPHIKLWRRYIDDIFLLWTGDLTGVLYHVKSTEWTPQVHVRVSYRPGELSRCDNN